MINLLYPDLLILIVDKLYYKDKITLNYVNKYINEICKIEKLKIYYYLYRDYISFYNYLNKYHFNIIDIDHLMFLSIKNIKLVYKYNRFSFYDMRYLFELLYKYDYRLSDTIIKELNIHFYIHFYNHLISVIDKDKKITKKNINKNKIIIQLHSDFKAYYKDSNTPIENIL